MAWSPLVDMELDDEDKLDAPAPIAMAAKPDYPYGLRICLTHRELAKLGLAADCEIGDMLDMRCFAAVTSISTDESGGGASCRIELQIQKMAVEDEMAEATNG